MKLAALALPLALGLGGLAAADPAPSGAPAPSGTPARSGAPASADDPSRAEFRQLLLQRFDRDHDGQLDAHERQRAARALRRIARRMADDDRTAAHPGGKPTDPAAQQARRQRRIAHLIERFDRNHDGVVSPDEMPPGLARRLSAIDRNGNGAIDPRDAP